MLQKFASVFVILTSAPRQDAFATLEFGLEVVASVSEMGWCWAKIASLKARKMRRCMPRMLLLLPGKHLCTVRIDGCVWIGL